MRTDRGDRGVGRSGRDGRLASRPVISLVGLAGLLVGIVALQFGLGSVGVPLVLSSVTALAVVLGLRVTDGEAS